MKKVIILLFLITCTALFSAEAASSDNKGKVEKQKEIKTVIKEVKPIIKEVPPDLKKIFDNKKIVVALWCDDIPPFFYKDEKGELQGYDIDLAKDIAKYLGVGVEFNRTAKDYNGLVELLEAEEVDMVISEFSRTLERAKKIRFTKPYLTLRIGLLLNRTEAVKRKIEDYPMDYLKEEKFKIGVMTGTSYVDFSKEMFKHCTVVEYENTAKFLDALKKGEILAAMDEENEIMKTVRKNPDIAVYSSVYILKDKKDYVSIAVPWQSEALLAWLDTYLENYEVKTDVKSLIKKYPEVYEEKK